MTPHVPTLDDLIVSAGEQPSTAVVGYAFSTHTCIVATWLRNRFPDYAFCVMLGNGVIAFTALANADENGAFRPYVEGKQLKPGVFVVAFPQGDPVWQLARELDRGRQLGDPIIAAVLLGVANLMTVKVSVA